ncbi:hypothetical protein HMPREF0043_00807 [Actinobaculum sp. oral taxon 183 str. F0552]|nr:hypothetical protein HMPREF0043_00807 [Actinobaculum sp. oral taxon 183 str. F0552]
MRSPARILIALRSLNGSGNSGFLPPELAFRPRRPLGLSEPRTDRSHTAAGRPPADSKSSPSRPRLDPRVRFKR